ncbi:hypothetical protein HHI36_016423 [Cryptolaemus montrouzieri]|uniref:Uncharacterized protein n=1 Tax=Cryptolaemus montrouzieri TaxID=559131 RepID=A0ABD2NJN0_9CUCU
MCLTYEKRTSSEMAKRNVEGNGKVICDNTRTNKNRNNTSKSRKSPVHGSATNIKSTIHTPEPKNQVRKTVPLPISPSRMNTGSPVLLSTSPTDTKQYAGCKWTEPPSPSTVPHPPLHWMQRSSQPLFARPFQSICQTENDIAHQLKVLLKVQA